MKKISKTAQLKKDRAINKQIVHVVEQKILQKERNIEDKKDNIKNLNINDIKKFNSNSFMEALKNSGIQEPTGSVFADMERIVNNNESIRELVDIKNIRLKTKVTEDQHKIIVILYNAYYTMLRTYGINVRSWENLLNEFIELSPSIDGGRAEQFVTAHQAVAQAVANAQHNNNAIREPSEMKQ